MSVANWGTNEVRWLDLYKKTITESYTVIVGADHYRDSIIICDDCAADATITLPDGIYIGQRVVILVKSDVNNKTVTVTPDNGTGSSLIVENDFVEELWSGENWIRIASTET